MRLLPVAVALAALALTATACASGTDPTPIPTRAVPSRSAPTATPSETATPTPSATPSPTASPAAGGTYLALGDSLAVGVGASRPELGYVGRLFEALTAADDARPRVTRLQSLAVSGETSTSMIRTGQLVAALDAIATADPPASLVTLDIGGNDLLRLLDTDACASAPLGAECLQLLSLTLDDFEANFRQIVGELLAALDQHAPDTPLAVMTYFNAFSGTDDDHEAAGELALLGTDGRLDCRSTDPDARGMNDIIACVAVEMGAVAVDIHPRFTGLGLELTHIGAQDIHANDRGYAVIAELFLAGLR